MPNAQGNNNPTAGSSSPSAPQPPWIELPRDLMLNILRRLCQVELLEGVENVCSTWRNLCCEPSLWRVVDVHPCYSSYDTLCGRAVERSRGELIEIFIKYFGTDELLRYISDRSRHLKRLTLESCTYISAQCLMTAIKNFSHLEELHISYIKSSFNVDIEFIGISCPLLKSFSFKNINYDMGINNCYALLIAKYMPNLCRLCLVRNGLSNEGLQAILGGCPNLQSLVLRQCCNVDLKSDIGRRFLERIKGLGCGLVSYDDDDDGDSDYYYYDYDYNYDYELY